MFYRQYPQSKRKFNIISYTGLWWVGYEKYWVSKMRIRRRFVYSNLYLSFRICLTTQRNMTSIWLPSIWKYGRFTRAKTFWRTAITLSRHPTTAIWLANTCFLGSNPLTTHSKDTSTRQKNHNLHKDLYTFCLHKLKLHEILIILYGFIL